MPLRYTLGEVSEDRRDRQRDVASGRSACQPPVPGAQDDGRVPPRMGYSRDGDVGGARAAHALREV